MKKEKKTKMVDNFNAANNNDDNNNNNNNNIIVSDIEEEGPRSFPEPFQKENVTFMRLTRRLKQQEEFRNFYKTPQIDAFIRRFPVYGAYEALSFRRAFNAVQRWFQQCK